MAARLRRLRMDGTEILGRLLPLALHRSDARQTEAPSRPLSEARIRRPERGPPRARGRLASAMAGRASRKTSRRRPRDVRARASRRRRRSLLTPMEKQAAAFLQPPALPEPASSDKRRSGQKPASIPLEPAPSRSCRPRPAEGRASSSRPSRRSRPPRTGRSRRCRCSCPSG